MAMNYVDTLVKEFLIFRGFASTLKQFDAELKADRDRSFRADRIVEYFQQCINNHDLTALVDLFNHFNCNIFSKLEQTYVAPVKKLQYGVYKVYLVTAHNNNKPEKVTEFFTKLSSELQGISEWKDWFVFPFVKNPEENTFFSLYFSKSWQDTLWLSLHNFLATIFQCMPQPTLTRTEGEVALIKRLQDENAILRNRLQQMQQQQQQQNAQASSSSSSARPSTSYGSGTAGGSSSYGGDSKFYTLNDIIPIEIPPPTHIVDDFYIIAQETLSVVNAAESQAKGLKSLIRNISAGGSPVLGRKDGGSAAGDKTKRRSGSLGRKE